MKVQLYNLEVHRAVLGENLAGQRIREVRLDSKDIGQLLWNLNHDFEATVQYLNDMVLPAFIPED